MQIESEQVAPPRGHHLVRYPFRQLEVGQSFFIEGIAGDHAAILRVRGAANVQGRRTGKKYSVRKMDGGVRVWRVK